MLSRIQAIIDAGDGSMPDTDICQEGLFFTNRDLTSIGVKTWMSISSLQNRGMYLFKR